MPFGTTRLNDGNEMPQIAYGTGTANKRKEVADLVKLAIETGFWHIDTAQSYENEESVGRAIRESGLRREQIFITTKYLRGDIRTTFETSLKKLGVRYVDLYLIHVPNAIAGRAKEAWKELEQLKTEGLAKSIGVSNFTIDDLRPIVETAKIPPAVNQIKFHPYNYAEHKSLLDFCAKHRIIVEGYSSLASITRFPPGGPVDKPVQAAAKRLGVTPAQVLLAWARSKDVVIVTTTSKLERLKEYLAVGDLGSLTSEEKREIEEAGFKGPNAV